MDLENLRIYKISMELGERIWNIVLQWDYLAVDTVGKQLIRSADSIAANISEGFGRYLVMFQEVLSLNQKPGLQKHTTGN
jgi:four helix bundle protein